jgi:hypothetical protein
MEDPQCLTTLLSQLREESTQNQKTLLTRGAQKESLLQQLEARTAAARRMRAEGAEVSQQAATAMANSRDLELQGAAAQKENAALRGAPNPAALPASSSSCRPRSNPVAGESERLKASLKARQLAFSAKRKRDVESNLEAATALSQNAARYQRTSTFHATVRVASSLAVLEREV